MTREDRELLAELARLNGDVAPLALRIMEGSASSTEQRNYAQRLVAAGQRLHQRADRAGPALDGATVIDGYTSLETADAEAYRSR